MKVKHRYKIESLPIIPDGSEFVINGRYAKIQDGLLYLWNKSQSVWSCTNNTLSEYNDYLVPEESEYNLGQIMYNEFLNNRAYLSGFKVFGYIGDSKYCMFRDWDDEYKISLYPAKKKGFKGAESKDRYSGGACIVIRKELYPQLEELIGDDLLMVKPIDRGLR